MSLKIEPNGKIKVCDVCGKPAETCPDAVIHAEHVDDIVGMGGAYYLPPSVGDSPFDHGDSMESLLRQGAALYSAMGTYNQAVRRYCQRALQMFETPRVVEPLPPTAIAHHVENMATLAVAQAPAKVPAKGTVASNYSVQVDHARHLIMVHVDVSGDIKRSDGKTKETGEPKYHVSKRDRYQRTIHVPDSQLAFTFAVGWSPVLHVDAMSYDVLTARMRAQAPVTPVHNIGVSREGDTFTIFASFDERAVATVTRANGLTVYAKSQSTGNKTHRSLRLTDGLWFTFYMFSPA